MCNFSWCLRTGAIIPWPLAIDFKLADSQLLTYILYNVNLRNCKRLIIWGVVGIIEIHMDHQDTCGSSRYMWIIRYVWIIEIHGSSHVKWFWLSRDGTNHVRACMSWSLSLKPVAGSSICSFCGRVMNLRSSSQRRNRKITLIFIDVLVRYVDHIWHLLCLSFC